MDARYQDPSTGRFLSEDPLFNAIGANTQVYGKGQDELLRDPQSLNSYGYVRNNPLRYTDPTGASYYNQITGISPFATGPNPTPSFPGFGGYNGATAFALYSASGGRPLGIGNAPGSTGSFYYEARPQPGTLGYAIGWPFRQAVKPLQYSGRMGQQYRGEVKQNQAEGKTWIAAMRPRSPETQAWGNFVTTVDAAYAGQALKLGVLGTAGLSALGGIMSHAGDNGPITRQDVVDIGSNAVTSALNRGVGALAGSESILGSYSLIPDVTGEYIIGSTVSNFTSQLLYGH
jgi:RHS repeat-associated protein